MSASVCPSGGRVAEIAPAVDDLLGRAAADAELQATAGDDIRRARILRHVERVLVAHVDDRRTDLDAAGPGADRRQQREGRAELAGEVMHRGNSAVRAEFLGGDGEVYRLRGARRTPSASATAARASSGRTTRNPIFFMAVVWHGQPGAHNYRGARVR